MTQCTFSGPIASTAIAADRAESIPPDKPMIIPGKLFLDVASGISLPENYYMAGGIILGPFIMPLYQSWEQEHKIPNNIEWIKERIRFVWFLSSVNW